jgi:uncharacterized membrane protein YgdD (TMEM256/DUF423 family)
MIAGLRFFLVFACASAALSIGASAIAAHGLTLTAQDARALAWALDLQRFHALALLVLVVLARQGGPNAWTMVAGALFVAGTLLFSLNIELRLMYGIAYLRPLVPYGGMALMAGWVALAIGGWRMQQDHRA